MLAILQLYVLSFRMSLLCGHVALASQIHGSLTRYPRESKNVSILFDSELYGRNFRTLYMSLQVIRTTSGLDSRCSLQSWPIQLPTRSVRYDTLSGRDLWTAIAGLRACQQQHLELHSHWKWWGQQVPWAVPGWGRVRRVLVQVQWTKWKCNQVTVAMGVNLYLNLGN